MKRAMKVQDWNERRFGPISEKAVRQLQESRGVPLRISSFKYPAATRFKGSMRSGVVYILHGSCTYFFDDCIHLNRGQYVILPSGDYEMEVTGEEEVHLVLAWELPELHA